MRRPRTRLLALLAGSVMLLAPGSVAAQEADPAIDDSASAVEPVLAQPLDGGVSIGTYECSFYGAYGLQFTPGLNVSIIGPGAYTDAVGAPGTYTFDARSQTVTFVGAAVDGERARYSPTSTPKTLTYLGAHGNLLAGCELAP